MKKYKMYLLIFIFVIIVCVLLNNVNINPKDTINSIDFNTLEFKTLEINEAKLNRYNELINIPQVSFLIRNLSSVLEMNEINTEMSIVYCYNYAANFKNDSENYIVKDNQNTYIDCDYTESIIYELFDKNVNLDKYKQQNGYLVISGENLKTDTIEIKVKDVAYNSEYDLYKIVIQEYERNINIIYKYKEGKYTLLSCLEDMNME